MIVNMSTTRNHFNGSFIHNGNFQTSRVCIQRNIIVQQSNRFKGVWMIPSMSAWTNSFKPRVDCNHYSNKAFHRAGKRIKTTEIKFQKPYWKKPECLWPSVEMLYCWSSCLDKPAFGEVVGQNIDAVHVSMFRLQRRGVCSVLSSVRWCSFISSICKCPDV